MFYGTATNAINDEPLTIEKLRKAMALLPRSKGNALLKGSSLVDAVYRIPNDIKIGSHLFMVVVPEHFLGQMVSMTNARPSTEIDGAYEYPVYSLLKDDIF